jgi:hypothetical protein
MLGQGKEEMGQEQISAKKKLKYLGESRNIFKTLGVN